MGYLVGLIIAIIMYFVYKYKKAQSIIKKELIKKTKRIEKKEKEAYDKVIKLNASTRTKYLKSRDELRKAIKDARNEEQ